MRHNIVEGEPGIFPDPIARFFRWIFSPLGRRRREKAPPVSEQKDRQADDSA